MRDRWLTVAAALLAALFGSLGLLRLMRAHSERQAGEPATAQSKPSPFESEPELSPHALQPTTMPNASDNSAAELQYKIARDYFQRGDLEQARESLGDLLLRYPYSRYAGQARQDLSRLAAQGDKVSAELTQRAARESYAEWKARLDQGRAAGSHAVITEDDIAVLRSNGEALALGAAEEERVSLLSASAQNDSVVLRVAYRLRAHARPVRAVARVSFRDRPENFSSSSGAALSAGSGEARITVPVEPGILSGSLPSSIRLMLVEEQGSTLVSQEVPYPER